MTEDARPIKLYLAILNEGWMRAEHLNTVFLASNTDGIKLVMETPGLTWDKPIASNRNRIVKRFLKTDCDFLCMIDDDVVPLFNIAELAFYNKDIVGAPTRRRKAERLEWVVYKQAPKGEGYYSVDLDRIDPNTDLLQADAIGTGCIVIKREVLEKVRPAFVDIFDEDGIRCRGMDLNFCTKAIDAGFEVFVSPKKICEHFRDFGLVTMDAHYISHAQEEPQVKYGLLWGDIIERDWDMLKEVIEEEGVKSVLEFEPSVSTLLMSELVPVDSYSTNGKNAEMIKSKVPEGRKVGFHSWSGHEIDVKRGKNYDLAFVNGPNGQPKEGEGKEVAIKYAAENADRVIVRNAGRIYESMIQEKYLRPDFTIISKNGWHQGRCQYWKRKSLRG